MALNLAYPLSGRCKTSWSLRHYRNSSEIPLLANSTPSH
jgi:hypothetical protein